MTQRSPLTRSGMWQSFRLIFMDAGLRVATLTMLCLGFTYAATFPYLAIIGVKQLGISEHVYAILMTLMAIAGTAGSLWMGHLSDQVEDRKRLILVGLAIGAFGYGLVAAFPSPFTFVFCLLAVMPFSGSVYIQLYAAIRAISSSRHPDDVVSINSGARAIYALSWIVVPGLVGLMIATRGNATDSFAVAALAFTSCFVLYSVFGPSSSAIAKQSLSGLAGFRQGLFEIANFRIASRVLALAMIATIHPANAALLPLFVLDLGGSTRDVGIIAGLVAGLEIPFMIWGGALSRRVALWKIIAVFGLVYGLYFILLAGVSAIWQVYALSIVVAAGAAIMLTLHVSYYQDLLPAKPGLGTSLASVSSLVAKGLGAAVFALAGTVMGFSGAVLLGAAIAISGVALLWFMDRHGQGLPA